MIIINGNSPCRDLGWETWKPLQVREVNGFSLYPQRKHLKKKSILTQRQWFKCLRNMASIQTAPGRQKGDQSCCSPCSNQVRPASVSSPMHSAILLSPLPSLSPCVFLTATQPKINYPPSKSIGNLPSPSALV